MQSIRAMNSLNPGKEQMTDLEVQYPLGPVIIITPPFEESPIDNHLGINPMTLNTLYTVQCSL
ncbi:18658_t:CDS:1, partial [Acaulospora morrowiae]